VAGGLRWAHVDDDSLCFLRETASERLLVLARRSAGASTNVASVGAVAAENIYGGARAACAPDGSVTLPGDGPRVHIWRVACARLRGKVILCRALNRGPGMP